MCITKAGSLSVPSPKLIFGSALTQHSIQDRRVASSELCLLQSLPTHPLPPWLCRRDSYFQLRHPQSPLNGEINLPQPSSVRADQLPILPHHGLILTATLLYLWNPIFIPAQPHQLSQGVDENNHSYPLD